MAGILLLLALVLTILKLAGVAAIGWWMVILAIILACIRPLILFMLGCGLLLWLASLGRKHRKVEF